MQRSRWAPKPEQEEEHTQEAAPTATDTTASPLNPESATFQQQAPMQASYAPVCLPSYITKLCSLAS
jgi:hypothetical protein